MALSLYPRSPVRSIVELGSGLSTILLAALQRDGYLERWVSLEHDPDWHLYVLQRLRQKSLSVHAQVMLCPLVQSRLEECQGQWYDTRMIAPFPAQLVLIDGPPGYSAPLARYPAPYQLKAWMTPGTWLILDDADRPPEQETIRRWLDEIPSLAWIATIPTNTGLAVLQFME
jgi:Methyltransferase domain